MRRAQDLHEFECSRSGALIAGVGVDGESVWPVEFVYDIQGMRGRVHDRFSDAHALARELFADPRRDCVAGHARYQPSLDGAY